MQHQGAGSALYMSIGRDLFEKKFYKSEDSGDGRRIVQSGSLVVGFVLARFRSLVIAQLSVRQPLSRGCSTTPVDSCLTCFATDERSGAA